MRFLSGGTDGGSKLRFWEAVRSRISRHRFRDQLTAIFFLLILFTAVTVAFMVSVGTTRILRNNARENQVRTIHQTITNINLSVASIENSYLYFASNESVFASLRGQDTDDFETILRVKQLMFSFVIHIDGLDTVLFIPQDGGRTISNLGGLVAPGFFRSGNPVGEAVFEALIEDPRLTRWYLGDVEKTGKMYYLRSLFDPNTGQPTGILAFIVDLSLFSKQIADLAVPGGGVVIADENGVPFCFSNDPADRIDAPLNGEAIAAGHSVLIENRNSMTIIHPMRNGWFIASEIPKSTLYKDINLVFVLGMVITVICIILSSVLGVFVSRRYTRDLSNLVNAMDTSSEGRLETLSSRGSTEEFRHLAATYNSMIRNIQGLTRELKQEVDEKTEAEAALRELNETLERRVEDRTTRLQESLETLQLAQSHLIESEKMASLGSLVAGLAHEINTPVGIAITGASFLADRTAEFLEEMGDTDAGEDSRIREFIEAAREISNSLLTNMRRVADLVGNFKMVSVDQSHDSRRIFIVRDYFESVLESVRPGVGGLELEIRCPEALTIDSYPGVFGQILTNLIMNARLHAFPDQAPGTVSIKVSVVQNSMVVDVSDNGRGMAGEVRDKVFEPFFTTSRNRGGTGLGLHITYNLVTQKLGGRIECLSEPDRGTRFIMIVPRQAMPKSTSSGPDTVSA